MLGTEYPTVWVIHVQESSSGPCRGLCSSKTHADNVYRPSSVDVLGGSQWELPERAAGPWFCSLFRLFLEQLRALLAHTEGIRLLGWFVN